MPALQPHRLDAVFRTGARFRIAGEGAETDVVMDVRPAGRLRMPSGQLVAWDPDWLDVAVPFTTTVEPGEYPVELAVASFVHEPDHVRTAAARVTMLDEPVASWELATTSQPKLAVMGEDGQEYSGFGVDLGMACFVDFAATEVRETRRRIGVSAMDELYETLDEDFGDHIEIGDRERGNAIIFTAGWGDGVYPTWIGRTDDGRVACFVADMLVVHGCEVVG